MSEITQIKRGKGFSGHISYFVIPGSTEEKSYLAVWNGHEFEVWSPPYRGEWDRYNRHYWDLDKYPHETRALLYHPVDPRIIVEDVRASTHAYLNEAGTHWLFSHCSPAYHFDKELELVAVVESVFQKRVELRLGDCLTLTGSRLTSALSSITQSKRFGIA